MNEARPPWQDSTGHSLSDVNPPLSATHKVSVASEVTALESKLQLNQQAREREKKARFRAEELLEKKSRELFFAQKELQKQFQILEQQKQELELLSSVTTLARDHDNLKEVLKAFVDAVCKMCGWPVGHVYGLSNSETHQLTSLRIWHLENIKQFVNFKQITESTPFKLGEGLPGRVLETGKSLWIEDVQTDPNFPRNKLSDDLFVHSAFGVPITNFGKMVAVCEFFTPNSFEKNEHFDEQLPLIPCLPGELNQVFLNLIVNAAHAIDERFKGKQLGKIIISTELLNQSAIIKISDNGNGIPEEARSKIFDPFFTTKGVGKGSGQGLAIAHSVIFNKHKGQIDFETQLGVGTTFIIKLPLQEK